MKKVLSCVLTIGLLFSTFSFSPMMVSAYASKIITFEDQTPGSAPNIAGMTVTPGADNTVTVEKAYHDLVYKSTIPDGTLTVPEGTGNALKFARNAAGKTTAVMEVDVGVLPDDFAVGFTALENCDNFKVELVSEGNPNVLICDAYANLPFFLKKVGTVTTNRAMVTQNIWSPILISFRRSIAVPSYSYSITGNVKDEKTFPLTTEFDGVDKTKATKLVFTVTLNGGTVAAPLTQFFYLDNIFVNKVDATPQKNYTFDFEDQQATAPVALPGMFNSGAWAYSTKSITNATLPFRYTSTSHNIEIANDPIDVANPNNKVLMSKRGSGSNQFMFQGITSIVVPRPTSDFSIEFRVADDSITPTMANAECGINLYATDGTNKIMPPNANSTTIQVPGTVTNTDLTTNYVNGKIIGGLSRLNKVIGGDGFAATTTATPINTWVKVKMVYNLAAGTDTYYINDGPAISGNKGTAAALKTIFDGTTKDTMTLTFVPSTYVSALTSFYLDDIVVKVDENAVPDVQDFTDVTYDETVAGSTTVAATVGSGAWLSNGAIVVSAVYTAAGDMVDVDTASVTSLNKVANLVLNTSNAGAGYYIKTMLWNSLDSLTPFVDAVTHTPVQ